MTIYWLCPEPKTPSGGVWYIHALAFLLDQAGVRSRVLQKPRFGIPWWVADPLPESILADEVPTKGDVVVVPEVMWPTAAYEDARKVVFLQGRQWAGDKSKYPAGTEIIVPSRYLANYVQRTYGYPALGKITPYPASVFQPTPKEANRVLLYARRNEHHKATVAALEQHEFPYEVLAEPLTQAQLQEKFSRAEFYVHLAYPEGFPLACLEAMRAGTIVVGTTGGGGVEFMFNYETALVVQDPEAGRYGEADFIQGIVSNLLKLREDPDLRSKLWTQARAWSERYTAERTTEEALKVFGS